MAILAYWEAMKSPNANMCKQCCALNIFLCILTDPMCSLTYDKNTLNSPTTEAHKLK